MRGLAVVLVVTTFLQGCATAGLRERANTIPRDPALMRDYVQHLPIGSRIRVRLETGELLRGTLMKVTDEAVIVQAATRIPEPPVVVSLGHILMLELDQPERPEKGRAIVGASAMIVVIIVLTRLAVGGAT
jgi:hypothetical protein